MKSGLEGLNGFSIAPQRSPGVPETSTHYKTRFASSRLVHLKKHEPKLGGLDVDNLSARYL